MQNDNWKWLRSRPAQLVTAALIIQAVLFYNVSHGEAVPLRQALEQFPRQVGAWNSVQDGVVDEATNAILRADDTLVRTYAGPAPTGASLFIAYFQSQRQGQSPHSPKHCMPGAGWSPTATGVVSFPVAGRTEPVQVNRFVLQKGDAKTVVLYWYQANKRVISSEYYAKVYLVWDSIRYNRSDTALVRIMVPVTSADGDEAATQTAISFAQAMFPNLGQFLPA